MIPDEAFRFGEAAIRRGWCRLKDVAEAMAAQRHAAAKGEVPPHIEDLLVASGALDEQRVAALLGELRLTDTGDLVAGYRILGRLGSGGIGTVYHARQITMDRDVALKVLPVTEDARPGDAERFLREARSVARLEHPHIVRGLDAGEANGVRYLVMELLHGETALQALRRGGPLGETRSLAIVLAITKALEHAWTLGLVHRDVKPSNVFLEKDGRIVLFDFGLAKDVVDDPFSTEGMRALGTPHYAAPEQIRRDPDLDIRTDLYSLGGTWYHLLTGRVPFPAGSSAAIAARHLHDEFPDAAQGAPRETLRAADAIIRRLTAKRREDRYPDPTALRADLETLAGVLERIAGGGPMRLAARFADGLLRRTPAPAAEPAAEFGGLSELRRRLEELQEENARLFCERDLLHHEARKDESTIEHLEADNARLACSVDLLRIEVDGLRAALDGMRLRTDAQRGVR